jgi:hypothetical protein
MTEDRPTTLYKFFDSLGTFLYVGITTQKSTRFYQH